MMENRKRGQGGFSLIELLIVIAIILIILAIAVPKLGSARMQAQEMAAMRHINAIQTGQTMYLSQFGKYAATLPELGPPTSGNAGPAAADLIPGELASGDKGGYKFVMTQTPIGFAISAVPNVFNSTGRRTFFSDQSLVIRQNWSQEPATATSPELK